MRQVGSPLAIGPDGRGMKKYSAMPARYIIHDTFKITGRGIVFAGRIESGTISIGEFIEFQANNRTWKRKITGVDFIRHKPENEVNLGLLIQCENDEEIGELRNWRPNREIGIVANA